MRSRMLIPKDVLGSKTFSPVWGRFLLLVCFSVFAFAPTNQVLPTIYEEVLPINGDFSALNSSQWIEFKNLFGDNWQISFDPHTGIPHRIFGGSARISSFPTVDESNIKRASQAFIEEWAEILQIETSQLQFERAEKQGRIWYVSFTQVYNGITVFNSRLHLRVDRSGSVMLMGSEFKPEIDVNIAASLNFEAALAIVQGDLGDIDNSYQDGLIIYSLVGEKQYNYHLAHLLRLETSSPPGWWEYVIDAHSGEILHRVNNLNTLAYEGTITGTVKPEYSDDTNETYEMPEERLYIDASPIYTDLDGFWSLDLPSASHTFETQLYGSWVDVNNEDATDASYSTTFSNAVHNFTWTTSDALIDEITIYYHINFIHDYWKNTMGFDDMDFRMTATVQVGDDYDNAYYSGGDLSINFGAGGSYFYNLALHCDVVYHEYTHGVTDQIYPGGTLPYTGQSGALNEGFSDYFPASILGGPLMGERLYRSSRSLFMRSCDNTNKYPDDFVDEVHHDALILTGALWEIRADVGAVHCDNIVHHARFGYPENYEDLLVEILIADDDDGDLGNGTPNAAIIYSSFFAHGIGPGLALNLYHSKILDNESSSVSHTAIVDVTTTVNVDLAESFLKYSTTGSAPWAELALTATGTTHQYSATIPPQAMETEVSYYLQVENVGDQISTHPEEGVAAPHTFRIGIDSEEPVITHVELPPQSFIVWPSILQCDIEDNLGLFDVWCELMVNSVPVASISLSETETLHRWLGYITCDVEIGDIVSYRIFAEDASMAGNTAILPESGWFSFEVVDYYIEPFEYEYVPYTHYRILDGYGDQWNIVDYFDHTPDGTKSYKCGSPDYGLEYMDLVDAALVTPVLNLGESSTLTFWHWMRAEVSGYWGTSYDGGIVEARSVGGSWELIEPVGDYPTSYRNDSGTGPFSDGTPCFGGEYNWTENEFDLSDYVGPTEIRWRFGSDRATTYEGWYVDDIMIETVFLHLLEEHNMPTTLGCMAYPNPFNAACNITFDKNIKNLEILDIKGRVVLNLNVSDLSSFIWEPQGLPSGIYTARLTGPKRTESMRVLYMK